MTSIDAAFLRRLARRCRLLTLCAHCRQKLFTIQPHIPIFAEESYGLKSIVSLRLVVLVDFDEAGSIHWVVETEALFFDDRLILGSS